MGQKPKIEYVGDVLQHEALSNTHIVLMDIEPNHPAFAEWFEIVAV